jgi:hypothetical protein
VLRLQDIQQQEAIPIFQQLFAPPSTSKLNSTSPLVNMHFNNDQFRSGIEPNGVSSQTFDGDASRQPNGHANGIASGYTEGLASGATTPTAGIPEPIAICGLALRLPGGIRSAEGFWDVLKNGKDTRGPIPPDRYNVDGFSNAMGKKGTIQTEYGYFLNEDLSCLDTSFFSMGKSELEKMDPQQRQILEVARECLESAGEVSYRGKQIGCYVGTFGEDWLQSQSRENQYTGGYNVSGDLMIANRVSYEYDLRGPRYVDCNLFRGYFPLAYATSQLGNQNWMFGIFGLFT